MLPLRDSVPTSRFAIVTVAIIAANFAVWLFYEIPGGVQHAVFELGYRPCEVVGHCPNVGEPWPLNAVTLMFTHGGWEHIIGIMLFLWIFGNNVEDTLGRVRFIAFYFLAGFAATGLQTIVTLAFATRADESIPNVGASGAIAGVLGAYIVLFPAARVLTWMLPIFFFELPAFLFLGLWFAFQLWDGGYAFTHPVTGGNIAYFAHIGGFAFGALTIKLFAAGRPPPRLRPAY